MSFGMLLATAALVSEKNPLERDILLLFEVFQTLILLEWLRAGLGYAGWKLEPGGLAANHYINEVCHSGRNPSRLPLY